MENYKLYLIKEGEISLKGGNRSVFENKLKNNLKLKLKPYSSLLKRQKGRFFLFVDSSCPDELIDKALSTTYGITGYAPSYLTEKSLDAIINKVKEVLPSSTFKNSGTFKVHVVREDKSFCYRSKEVEIKLAEIVHTYFPALTVNLTKPDYVLTVEIRKDVYIYTTEKKGLGGLPVTSAGKGILLLSGGIDSPVAASLMAKRGMKLTAVYFHAYPYTSEMALEKVKKLSSIISPYLQGVKLYVVPFTKGQEYIRDFGNEEEATLMFRAAMIKIASIIEKKEKALALITGEALSQVASQTLEAMDFTSSMTDSLILRPLVGMDKEEIINISKKLGTYETSILPYEDSCVVFAPKHPVTRPNLKVATEHFNELNLEPFINKAVEEAEIYYFDPMGNEYKNEEADS